MDQFENSITVSFPCGLERLGVAIEPSATGELVVVDVAQGSVGAGQLIPGDCLTSIQSSSGERLWSSPGDFDDFLVVLKRTRGIIDFGLVFERPSPEFREELLKSVASNISLSGTAASPARSRGRKSHQHSTTSRLARRRSPHRSAPTSPDEGRDDVIAFNPTNDSIQNLDEEARKHRHKSHRSPSDTPGSGHRRRGRSHKRSSAKSSPHTSDGHGRHRSRSRRGSTSGIASPGGTTSQENSRAPSRHRHHRHRHRDGSERSPSRHRHHRSSEPRSSADAAPSPAEDGQSERHHKHHRRHRHRSRSRRDGPHSTHKRRHRRDRTQPGDSADVVR